MSKKHCNREQRVRPSTFDLSPENAFKIPVVAHLKSYNEERLHQSLGRRAGFARFGVLLTFTPRQVWVHIAANGTGKGSLWQNLNDCADQNEKAQIFRDFHTNCSMISNSFRLTGRSFLIFAAWRPLLSHALRKFALT